MTVHLLTQERWTTTWQNVTATPRASLFDELAEGYKSEQRHYHTVQHLEECLKVFDETVELAQVPAEVELALWFHDAIYDTRARDNEEQSRAWAERELVAGGASEEVARRVGEMILATVHDAMPLAKDAQLLVDIDLSILGAPEARFDEYEEQVQREYGWVPEELFRAERAKLLKALLERPLLYNLEAFVERLELRARANLKRSLSRLVS